MWEEHLWRQTVSASLKCLKLKCLLKTWPCCISWSTISPLFWYWLHKQKQIFNRFDNLLYVPCRKWHHNRGYFCTRKTITQHPVGRKDICPQIRITPDKDSTVFNHVQYYTAFHNLSVTNYNTVFICKTVSKSVL